MTIRAQIIADSVSPEGHRLTTFQLRYPRFIHAELMTHRVFSRNASSSRAIPVQRLIQDVITDPAMPLFWGRNQKGMQAREEHNDPVSLAWIRGGVTREQAWIEARDNAIEAAQAFTEAGYHKQIVNRILEPWAHINVVVTATSYANFFALRDHEDAQPEIQALAQAMKQCMSESTPVLLQPGQWHLPYIRECDVETITTDYEEGWLDIMKQVSVARCARTSYLTHDGRETSVAEDMELYERLVVRNPIHASPAEHQATPDTWSAYYNNWVFPGEHGNLTGWRQFRKMLPNEYVPDEPWKSPSPQNQFA